MEEIKLFAIVNLLFHVPDFLRLFMMSFKYGLLNIVTRMRCHVTSTYLSVQWSPLQKL